MGAPTWSALIGTLVKGEALTSAETAWAMGEIMDGAATPAQIAGFGVALRMKGETVAEVTGLAATMLDRATPISVPGPLVDLVGTGGDAAHTVNISTMGAIVAAAASASTVGVATAGEASQAVRAAAALGLPMSKPGDLRGGDAAHNATVAHSVLDGEPGPIRDTVVLNAAAALAAAEGVPGAGGL